MTDGLPPPPYWLPTMNRKHMTLPRQWLRQVRQHRGLTQRALAARIALLAPEEPMTVIQLSHIESGRIQLQSLRSSQMDVLRQALGVPVALWREVFEVKASDEEHRCSPHDL